MKTFEYSGLTIAGSTNKGLIEAFDIKEAREKLATQGILAERVHPVSQDQVRRFGSRDRVFTIDVRSLIYQELESLLKAGLPLTNALEILIKAPEMGANRKVLASVRDQIQEGSSLAEALHTASKSVSPFEKAVIEVGERSGSLDVVLGRLAGFLSEQEQIQSSVRTALIYPTIVLVLALAVGFVVLGVMVPMLGSLFAEIRVPLPALTSAVLVIGRVVMIAGVPALLLCLVSMALIRRRASTNLEFRTRLDRLVFATPLVGRAYTALVNLRFARTLALLLRGGVSILEGMGMAGRATGSTWIAQLAEGQSDAVRHGESLADAVRAIPPLGDSLPGWIEAGEASGNLEELLESAGARFQLQWNRTISRTIAWIEPLLIVTVGVFVLIVSLAILLPIFSLNQTLL